MKRRWLNRIRRRLSGRALPVWSSPAYRPPLAATAHTSGFEPRRADLALWYLLSAGVLSGRRTSPGEAGGDNLRTPALASWADLGRVHSAELLESLTHGDTLARIFATEAHELPIDAMLETLRLACGGTIAILDLDAHPPDGIARCLCHDAKVWIGSISAADWGDLGCVHERLLPENTGDERYLHTLDALLKEMPKAALTFVLAGGDVLAADQLGALAMSEAGVAERDLRVATHLGERGSVWLPAGGYSPAGWRLLAGTATILSMGEIQPIPAAADPMASEFAHVARGLENLSGDDDLALTEADLVGGLGLPGVHEPTRLLGYYTASGIELALSRFGLLDHLRRLGYLDLRVELHDDPAGDVFRLLTHIEGVEQALVEASLSRLNHLDPSGESVELLYVNWLTLRHPRARFTPDRPALPGQEVPGLGLARETTVLLARIAMRLHLVGVGFRPASYHVAYSARHRCSFADPQRQGRFRALRASMAGLPLIRATHLVDAGKVLLNGEVYAWEPDLMVHWLEPQQRLDQAEIERAQAACNFTLAGDVIT